MNEGKDAELWKVSHVQDARIWIPTTGYVRGKQVHFKTADGHMSYVEIPDDKYNAETVNTAIDEAVGKHIEVMGLRGPKLSEMRQ